MLLWVIIIADGSQIEQSWCQSFRTPSTDWLMSAPVRSIRSIVGAAHAASHAARGAAANAEDHVRTSSNQWRAVPYSWAANAAWALCRWHRSEASATPRGVCLHMAHMRFYALPLASTQWFKIWRDDVDV